MKLNVGWVGCVIHGENSLLMNLKKIFKGIIIQRCQLPGDMLCGTMLSFRNFLLHSYQVGRSHETMILMSLEDFQHEKKEANQNSILAWIENANLNLWHVFSWDLEILFYFFKCVYCKGLLGDNSQPYSAENHYCRL